MAAANARRLGIGNVEFRHGDWLQPLAAERFELIVSNPPYIAAQDPHLAQGDLRFEPRAALVSGADGLDAIRAIARDAPRHLQPGGWLLLEHGWEQGAAVRALLEAAGLARRIHRHRPWRSRARFRRAKGLAATCSAYRAQSALLQGGLRGSALCARWALASAPPDPRQDGR